MSFNWVANSYIYFTNELQTGDRKLILVFRIGVFRTMPNILNGAFCKKIVNG